MTVMFRRILLLAFTFFLCALNASAQTTNYQVYSLFVMNIAKYSSWPQSSAEFDIAVVGKSKVYDELAKYAERGVNGMKMKVRLIEDLASLGSPQILYLSDGKSSLIDEIIKTTAGKSIMIVTEREGLHKKGAGFSFFINENNNLRFDINNTELEKRNIKVAKNLSGMAHEVL
ncbi:MAG TPA: YfiR family protein [Cyclobacteriaceae bacterium]|nr:YfiR family protein [Cyclobacteriaceae bacterium]